MQFRVSTDILKSRADDARGKISNMQQNFESIADLITETSSYWMGDAGDLFRTVFNSQREEMTTIINRLNEFPDDLLQMAGIYEEGESEASAITEQLPNDVII